MAEDIARLVVSLEAKIDQFEKKLDRATGVANKKSKQIEDRFKKTNDTLSKGFKGAAEAAQLIHGPLSGISSRITTVSSAISRGNVAWATMAVGLGGVTYAAAQALEAFQNFETQSLVLDQVLRATGGSAGKTAQEIEELVSGIGRATLSTDDAARAAAATLLTFRTIAGDTFDRTLKLAQDLAAVGFGTIESSAVQLGKALENPAEGLAALRRVGVSFSEAQKGVIARLVETGRVAEAQGKVLDAIEMQVGGAGASAAGGLAGAYHVLAEATDDLLVSWGRQIAQAIDLEAKLRSIVDALDAINKATGGGSLEDQLNAVNERIDANRTRKRPAGLMGLSFDKTQEQELRKLLSERIALRAQLLSAELDEAEARKKGVEAQKQIERERAEGVVANLQKELDLAGKTAIERRKIVELGKAGVTAETEYGKQITRNIEAIAAADLALKNLTATQASLSKARAEADVVGRSDYEAARRLEIQRRLNEATALGIPITKEMVRTIEEEATAIAKAEDAVRDMRMAYEEVASQSKETLSQFIKDMKDGASATEALGNALDNIADKLIDMAVNDLVEIALGGLTGRGGNSAQGGLASGLASLFGFAKGGIAAHGRPQPLPRFAGGGVSRSAAIFGEAGPEAAVPLPDGRRIPVDLRAPSISAAGGGATNVTVAPVFNVSNGTPEGIDKLKTEIVPLMRQVAQSEIAGLGRRNRFAKIGF
jgi:hypothetical protein